MDSDSTILICSLQNPDIYPHEVTAIQLVETHISWVVLTGTYAYKIKKPVNLGFLDFSTLAKRKHYCEEELRLNSRLAPDFYLDVVTISGTPAKPVVTGSGSAIEYAVRMKQFDPDKELDKLLARNELLPEHIRMLATKVAGFHQNIAVADQAAPYGSVTSILAPCLENLEQINSLVTDHPARLRIKHIRQWTLQSRDTLLPLFVQRKYEGYIRECHGDLHLHNLALIDDDILIFDCIEFNPNLYWIDVISEIAFTIMDLDDHQQSSLAWIFLNRYLQLTGDYNGIPLLRYYLVYRAMVRAKVNCIRAHQHSELASDHNQVVSEFQSYLSLAEKYLHPSQPILLLMHGLSGSGKTTVASDIATQLGAIHVRSDIERKRLTGLTENQRSGSSAGQGIYTDDINVQTYDRLAHIATSALTAGYHIVIDAAFLSSRNRQKFYDLAHRLDTTVHLINCHAPHTLLKSRVISRYQSAIDASEANDQVLEHQLKTGDSLDESDMLYTLDVDTSLPVDMAMLLSSIST